MNSFWVDIKDVIIVNSYIIIYIKINIFYFKETQVKFDIYYILKTNIVGKQTFEYIIEFTISFHKCYTLLYYIYIFYKYHMYIFKVSI